ncbi:heterokaryon incompatibility [Bisporella sp. PMI_857]|nr:heterokaryon incompatibility [Bisporella sp. PMI_857]
MSIVITQLGDSVTYQALSYMWGDPEPKYLVQLNRKKFKVRKDLHKALFHIFPLKGKLNFWADEVCINQDDMQERESQVSLMRDIYKEAERVWAWLGQGTESEK